MHFGLWLSDCQGISLGLPWCQVLLTRVTMKKSSILNRGAKGPENITLDVAEPRSKISKKN